MALDLVVDVRPQLTMLSDLGNDIPDGMELGLNEAANIGSDRMDEELMRVLRKQTPYYRLQIAARPVPDGWVIHDGGVVYGPWLAGVSRRNAASRFKGYRHWQTVRQWLEQHAPTFIERQIALALRKAQG